MLNTMIHSTANTSTLSMTAAAMRRAGLLLDARRAAGSGEFMTGYSPCDADYVIAARKRFEPSLKVGLSVRFACRVGSNSPGPAIRIRPASGNQDTLISRDVPEGMSPMVSTYLAYNSIVRNFRQSMTRVAQQADVTRNAAYYKENIGKVKTVDDFLKNDRLYQYAMKAYGLEDMTYAKAFMKKVLQSDLSDPNSYANKLVDKRYREFAAAFSFGGSEAAIAQSANQTDEMIGLYTATVTRQVDAIDEDTRYYNLTIGSVTNVDQLLNDDRLRTYVFAAFGIDDSQWSRDTIRNVLGSDPSDPNSYVNTVWVSRLDDFDHRLDQAKADLTDASSKITSYMAQLSQPGADMNDLRAKITMERAPPLEKQRRYLQLQRRHCHDRPVCRPRRRVRVFARWDAAVRRIRPDRCQARSYQ